VGGSDGLQEVERLLSTRRLLLYPLDRFDEFLCVLERMWPDDCRDCSYPGPSNSATPVQVFSPDIIDQLHRLEQVPALQWDLELLASANRQLGQLVREYIGEESSLKECFAGFRRRCWSTHVVEHYLKRPARALRRIIP
jgi:hypothetical protein